MWRRSSGKEYVVKRQENDSSLLSGGSAKRSQRRKQAKARSNSSEPTATIHSPLLMGFSASWLIDDFASLDGGQGPVDRQGDGVGDETHRAIGVSELKSAGMPAAEGVIVVPLVGIEGLAARLLGVWRNGAGAVGMGRI